MKTGKVWMGKEGKTMTYNSLWALQTESAQEILRGIHEELSAHFNNAPRAFLLDASAPAQRQPYAIQNGIAVISISGVIDRVARISFFTGLPFTQGQDTIRGTLEAAMSDSKVKGILLSINSPGGAAAGTKELADAIAQAAKTKPMAAYADGLAASAAYWLASATGTVYAPVTAQVGSIGVIAVMTDWTKASERAGLVRTVLSSGKWKAAGSPDKLLTDEERALFQSQLETLHSIFKTDVAARMGITAPELRWAEGQTVLGEEALELGLVSAIARDQSEAVSMLAATVAKEEIMNLDELKAGYPDLVEELKAETARKCEEDRLAALQAQTAETLALVQVVAGAEVAAKIKTLSEAGLTSAQLKSLEPLIAGWKTEAKSREAEARDKALESIQAATGGALPSTGPVSENRKNPLLADAERRSRERMAN